MDASIVHVQEIYNRHIRSLSVAERLQLLEITARDLANTAAPETKKRSLLELEGLGAEIWQGIDAQKYVDDLRQEWDR
jgi:hypothetical protein